MSFAEKIKKLAGKAPAHLVRPEIRIGGAPAVSESRSVLSVEDFSDLAKAAGLPVHVVKSICTQNRTYLEWCIFLEKLVRGESAVPPSSTVPPGLEAIVMAVVSKVSNAPQNLKQFFEERAKKLAEEIARAIREIRKRWREAVIKVYSKRFKEAEGDIRNIIRELSGLRTFVPEERVVGVLVKDFAELFRRRFKKPVERPLIEGIAEKLRVAVKHPEKADESVRGIVELFRRAVIPKEKEVSAPKPSVLRHGVGEEEKEIHEKMAKLGLSRLGSMVRKGSS